MPRNEARASETLEQRQLYDEYVKMGDDRSLEAVMQFTKRCRNTVQTWSKRWDWDRRAQAEDKALIEISGSTETQRENKERKKLVLDIIDSMIKEVAVLDANGNVKDTKFKAKNVFDLRTLIEVRDEQLGLKQKGKAAQSGDINVDKAVFIIKK